MQVISLLVRNMRRSVADTVMNQGAGLPYQHGYYPLKCLARQVKFGYTDLVLLADQQPRDILSSQTVLSALPQCPMLGHQTLFELSTPHFWQLIDISSYIA